MLISCFSFTEIARRAARLMKAGGALLTLTYDGSNRVMPNYNVMGVAKAALEASVRYLAADFGPSGIRVNAISAGPVRTLAGAGIADARLMFNFQKRHAPLRRSVSIEEIGNAGLYLLSDLASGVTGEIHYVDSGYNIVSMPHPEALKTVDAAETAAEIIRRRQGLRQALRQGLRDWLLRLVRGASRIAPAGRGMIPKGARDFRNPPWQVNPMRCLSGRRAAFILPRPRRVAPRPRSRRQPGTAKSAKIKRAFRSPVDTPFPKAQLAVGAGRAEVI